MARRRAWTHRRGPMFPVWQLVVLLSFPTLLVGVGVAAVSQPAQTSTARAIGVVVLVVGLVIWAGAFWLQPWRAEGRWRFEKVRDGHGRRNPRRRPRRAPGRDPGQSSGRRSDGIPGRGRRHDAEG